MTILRFSYYLIAWVFFSCWERMRGNYTGYYDWPNRTMDEYVAARDNYYDRHGKW